MTGVLGALLAGGLSSRFGADKALAVWNGRSLRDHGLAALDRVCRTVIVCGPSVPHFNCIPDRPGPGFGPLGGLNAALHFASIAGFDRVMTIGCDTPDVPPSAIDALLANDDRAHFLESVPIIGCWPTALAHDLDRFVKTHPTRSVRAWAEQCSARRHKTAPIANINFRSDLEKLTSQMASR